MQATSAQFDTRAAGSVRHVTGQVLISFDKSFDEDVDFFTLDTSLLDAGDVLQGEGDVLQEWDRYNYVDYSDRMISMEYNRQEDPVSSVALATADVVLDNHDGYFTPGGTHIGYLSANLGVTSDNTSTLDITSDLKVVSSVTASSNGTLKSLTVRGFMSSGSTFFKGIVYSNSAGNPSTLLATSVEGLVTNTTEEELTVEFSGANQIAIANGTTYWIGVHVKDPGAPNFTISRGNTASARKESADTYSDGPASSFGAITTSNGPIDVYVTYETTTQGVIENDLADFILPQRPIRLFAGFAGENLPVFVGVTESMPEIDQVSRTVRFHCIDFMQTLLNRPLEEASLYQNMRTDDVLSDLLVSVGLLSSQFELDPGINIMAYAFFPTGMRLGEAIDKLMVAEQGRFYMDEAGMIRFKNRSNYVESSVDWFDRSNILEARGVRYDDVVNVVEVQATTRELQPQQKIWELAKPALIPPGEEADVWGEFPDPVTSCDDPEYTDSATTSVYTTNVSPDGTGETHDADINLVDTTLFGTSFKMTFENTGATAVYVTNIVLIGTPAKIVDEIKIREQDDASVAKYDEHVLQIENDFIQTAADARSRAIVILDDYSERNAAQEVTVKGNPALQLSDMINVGTHPAGEYKITQITGRLMDASFKQILTVKQFTRRFYFTLDESGLDGGDELAP